MEKDWSRLLPSDLSFVWFADRTTGRLARVRLPLEKGVGESPSDMASKESADASERCSVWSPKLGCGLWDGFGLLVCNTEYFLISLLKPECGRKKKSKRRRKESKLLQILVCWRSLLCRLFRKTVSLDILLQFSWLYIHTANFVANKALRIRHVLRRCTVMPFSLSPHTHTQKHTHSNVNKSAKKNPLKSNTVMEL